MPTIGNVQVSDDVIQSLQRAAAAQSQPARPGLGEVFSAAAKNTIGELRYGLPYQAAKLTGSLTPEAEATYRRGLAETAAASSAVAPASVSDLTSGRVGFGRFVGENLAASLPYMAGSVIGGALGYARGGATGAAIGAVAGGVPQFDASNVSRAVQEQGGLSDQAATRSLAVAPFQAAADAAVARFLPGAGKVFGDLAATQTGGFLRRTAVSMAKAAGTEAVTEAAQQFGERYAAGLPVGDADAAGEYVNAAVTAFALGGVLGAGGGFRRTQAVAKPAELVTPEDIDQHINGVLDGSIRALPAPADITVDSSGTARVNPSGTAPIYLPSPDQFRDPDYIVDSEGRVAPPGFEGEQAIAIDRNQPTVLENTYPGNVTPEVQAVLDQATPPADPSLLAGTALQRGLQGTSIEPPAPFTPLSSQQVVPPEAVPGAPRVPPPVIERPTNPQTGEEIPFDQHLADLKKGLRGGFVQQVQATDELDLMTKVYKQLFEEQDTRANTAKFAQRLGLIDENMQPTDLARYIEQEEAAKAVTPEVAQETQALPDGGPSVAEPAPASPITQENAVVSEQRAEPAPVPVTPAAPAVPAAPVVQLDQNPSVDTQTDPAFAAEWAQLKKDAGITRLRSGQGVLSSTPANRDAAAAQIFRALATDKSDAEVSQVEKLARKLGLITDDDAMDVTPRGRQVFLTTPEGLEEVVSAAREQGYAGKQASVFDRGVRAALGKAAPESFDSFEDLAAYEAGKVWAQDFTQNGDTRTAAQTQAIRNRQDARRTGKAVDRRSEVARPQLTPQQVEQAALNRLLDASNLRGVPDTEIAAIRRMIRDGATTSEVGKAIEKVQSNSTLFSEAPRQVADFTPARVDRGQPRFREIDQSAAPATKAQQRAEVETASKAYNLRSLVQFALELGGITDARAQKLHDLLDKGEIDRVEKLMKDFSDDAPAPRKRLPKPPEVAERSFTHNDDKLEQAITDRTWSEVVDHMVTAAPSKYYREIARRIGKLASNLEKLGAKFEVRVVGREGLRPSALNSESIKGFTITDFTNDTATVWLKGSEYGSQAAVNYQTLAHEMIHATTSRLMLAAERGQVKADTQVGRAVKDLVDLGNAVIAHYNSNIKAGTASAFETELYNGQNTLKSPREIIAWGLTNPDFQRYLAGIEYKPRQTVFGKLVSLLRDLLGLGGGYDNALTELLRASEQVFNVPLSEARSIYAPGSLETELGEAIQAPTSPQDVGAANRTAQAANDALKGVAERATAAVERINIRDIGAKTRRVVLGWLSHNQIDRQYGGTIPAIIEHSDAHRERVAIRSRFEQLGEDAYQTFEQLERANPAAAERVGKLMALTTEFQIDPEKSWDEHTWLQGDENIASLRRLHGDAVKLVNDMRRGDGAAWAAYQNFRALNEAQNFARMAVGLHGLVATDTELSLGIENSWANPADQFMRAENIDTAQQVRDYWAKMLDDQVAAATAFVRTKMGEVITATPGDQRAMRQHLSPVEMQIGAIYQAKAAMAKAPYFHLGRFGDNFGSMVVAKGPDGRVNPVAQRKVAELLEAAGFTDAQISADNTKPRIMLRFDTVDQTVRFRALALDMQRKGLLDAESEIKAGPRNRADNFGTADGLPAYVASYIQNLEASPMFAEDENMSEKERASLRKLKEDSIQLARDTWIESQPDTSISKVLTKRYTVPGYNKDMVRNFAHRWRVGSINIANVASAPKFNKAFTNLKAQYNDALVANRQGADGELLAPADPFTVQDVTAELKMRDARNPINDTTDNFDKLRGYAHSYFLGFSPAYGMVNMTQLGVTALPELAKKHGYSKSFHAMRAASKDALAIVKAAGSEAAKLGWKHWGDVAITDSVLRQSGLSNETRDFLQHMLATGTIDIGSMARSLGQVADNKGVGGATETYLRLSSAIGLYTETFSRLVTALAAQRLHGGYGPEARAYAAKTVSESMFDYQNWNTARQLGKKGFLGPVTPLVTQFMSYSTQVTEKLYSEVVDAFAAPRPGESAETAKARKQEARRFILGHLAAVTALSGTLGLPFMTVFATAIERMVDGLDDDEEPFDITASYRNFLAEVFGKDVAEVIARGAPRAFGVDVSGRVGEQNLLPFSEFLADRRSWKEALANSTGRSAGASISMLTNIADGGAQIADGDLLGGLKSVLPIALKGPTEVYRMTNEGYVDTKGNRLPMSPTASSYVWQLLGFSPSAKAEYSEARADQASRRGEITRQAGMLRQGITRALISGDRETARDLIDEAIKFDNDNPAFAVIPSLASSLARQQQTQAQSLATNTPVGVSMRDVAGQQATQYANFGGQ